MGMRCLRTDLSPLVPWRWLEATTWPNLNEGCCICGSGFNAFHQPKFATTVLTGHYLLSTIFDINEDAIYWLRWRKEDSIKTGQALRRQLDTSPRRLLLGNGPRSAVFSEHYFWRRGFDGCTALLLGRYHRFMHGTPT